LCARADELALGQCEKDSLLKEYPFLVFHDVPGWINEPLQDEEFRKLRDRYDELRRDPQKNAKELRELEDAMNARCEALAQALRTAEGSDVAEQEKMRVLHPTDAGASAAVGRGAVHEETTQKPEDAPGRAVEGSDAAEELDGKRLRRSLAALSAEDGDDDKSGCAVPAALYSVLPETVDGVAQGELYLEDDPYFQELLARYNELVPHGGEPTVPLAKQLHAQLCVRASQIAADVRKTRAADEQAAARVASLYPYVDPMALRGPLLTACVEADDNFRNLLHERDEELAKEGAVGDAKIVREKEAALNERAQEVALALRVEEKALMATLPFLGRSVKGIPLRELGLLTDP
ncbi:hypothetical protein DQ04_22281000, partial [Trypanosoma grayi]|uniref:hypothetical protein n=1 Tax=Trypanosoma grayi TaxID=71804 RepID=UPI0004F44BBC